MSSPDPAGRPSTLLGPVLAALAGAGSAPVVLIDGPSGAGKSTLADRLVADWPGEPKPVLVRLDDIYPGWQGLAAGIDHLTRHVLAPRAGGLPAAWQRYDWANTRAAEWHPVDPARPLIVEGCGALAAAHRPFSEIRIWLAADDGIRKRRALARDGDVFRSHWDEWQDEWEAYLGRDDPERAATIRLSGTTENHPPRSA
ncbi:ATP-binding protein [Cryobacterium fucosi]|uniref:ATP-binding protein n=1 Tax=Cryobacterium fucosi TaxID=1259157 RepID=UPI001F545E92|nr:ATP-binding protein [Cryobacterium fucosi]